MLDGVVNPMNTSRGLLNTYDAADEERGGGFGDRRNIKKQTRG